MHSSKRLLTILDGDVAKMKVVIFELWENLSMSLEETGAAGYMSEASAYLFQKNLSVPVPDVVQKLCAAGFLERQKGGTFCACFCW